MARGLQNLPNITAADSDYPNGRIKDNPGNNTGTPVNENSMGDIFQFFAKLMRTAAITPNGLPESEYSGQQYYQALRIACLPYKYFAAKLTQTGTANPVVVVLGNTIGTMVVTRVSTGSYKLAFSTSFLAAKISVKTDYIINIGIALVYSTIRVSGPGEVFVETFNNSQVLTDAILSDTSIEIQCFY